MEQPTFTKYIDLVSERLGGKVLYATDDFFAEKENLIKPGRGIFIPDKYTDRGKWMDGWESRRKRVEGHDWAIVKLAVTGTIAGVDIDTNHFLGNHPPHASLEACHVPEEVGVNQLLVQPSVWTEILPKSPLNPGSQHFFDIESDKKWTHVRLHIYPDGGVARLKVYGEVQKDWSRVKGTEKPDLAAAINGGIALSCNDMFFSSMNNLLMPGRGKNMGDGWETKRNRTPNNRDWVILKLGQKGLIEKVLLDTCHFKGNYPDTFSLCGINSDNNESVTDESTHWTPIIEREKLSADHIHNYEKEIKNKGPFSHVRLSIFPDGGVSRLRLHGIPVFTLNKEI